MYCYPSIQGMVCTLLFQTSVDKPWLLQDDQAVMNAIESVDFWSSYRIGRQATRYGHHQFAIKIFSTLCNRVSFFIGLKLTLLSLNYIG